MKRGFILFLFVCCISFVQSQTLNVKQGSVIYTFPASQTGKMTYSNGTLLNILNKVFFLNEIDEMYVDDSEVEDNTVKVAYDGTSAIVSVAGNIAQYITPMVNGAHVSLTQGTEVGDDTCGEITYSLSGTSTNGEFYLDGSYKATIALNGVTLTNPDGPALNIQNGKRINISVKDGTENTLKDASGGDWKAALRSKGHTEFKGHGILNVYGYTAHAIWSKEYVEMKNCTINVKNAVGDGINVNQYFLMSSGTLNISGVGDDGIQVSLDTEDDGTVVVEEENTGAFTMLGGSLTIATTATGSKGVKAEGIVSINEADETTLLTITNSGGVLVESNDSTSSACLKTDSIINISAGTLTLTNTGQGGRALVCDQQLNISGGTITARAEGSNFGSSGGNQGGGGRPGGGGGPGGSTSNSKGAKCIKSKGALLITGGKLSAYSANHEGIESKSTITISGGDIFVQASDDAVNASSDFTISGGYLMGYSTGNDGLDANGNFYIKGGTAYAISARSPEVAVDANTEGQKKLYLSGGIVVAVGGLESGSSLTQTCKSTSSYSQGSWYGLYSGSTLALAFKIPSSSNMGSPLVVTTSGTATLKKDITTSGGTSLFDGYGCVGCSASGGSSVSLSSYSR